MNDSGGFQHTKKGTKNYSEIEEGENDPTKANSARGLGAGHVLI